MPRFYHMGEGKPPFCLTYSSTEYIIYPPDQRWKRVDVEYSPGQMANGKPLKLKRQEWVIDDAPKGRKPQNYLDLSADQAAYLNSGKFTEEREYIKSAAEIGQQLAAEEDDSMRKHSEKMSDLQKKFAREEEELRAEHARVLGNINVAPPPVTPTRR